MENINTIIFSGIWLQTMEKIHTIFLMSKFPLLKVVARVDAQYSEYHGDVPCSVAELIESV